MYKEQMQKSLELQDMKKVLSYEEIQSNIYYTLSRAEDTPFYYDWYWCYRTYDNNVIIQFSNDRLYRVFFQTNTNDEMTISGYEPVKMEFVSKGEMISLDQLVNLNKSTDETIPPKKDEENLEKDCKKEKLSKLFDKACELLEIE